MESSPKAACPKCSSESITANKKGFSGGKAAAGAILTGGIGLLAGTIGSGKVIITCLACGHQWKPGAKPQAQRPAPKASPKAVKALLIILGVLVTLFAIGFAAASLWVAAVIFGLLATLMFFSAAKGKPHNP